MAKWDLSKLCEANSKKGNNSVFNLGLHGDEVVVLTTESNQIQIAVKKQTSADSFRATYFTFESQSQAERLFPAIMKGLQNDHR